MLSFAVDVRGVFWVSRENALADEDVGERSLVLGALAEGQVSGGHFLVDAAENIGAVDIETSWVFDLGEDGPGLVFLFGLQKDPAIDDKVIHDAIQFYCKKGRFILYSFKWTRLTNTQSRGTTSCEKPRKYSKVPVLSLRILLRQPHLQQIRAGRVSLRIV